MLTNAYMLSGVQQQDVAAVLLKIDPGSNGFIDYRKFIKVLVSKFIL
jgi:Ca2+-binding EF-hand superfamily protein